jgi:serine/threonine protein kinase
MGCIYLEDIRKEIDAAKKLCTGAIEARNLVNILNDGVLAHSNCYFIDMELCSLNLEQYVYGTWPVSVQDKQPYFEYIQGQQPLSVICKIMADITCGVKWVHSHDLVHRDLKPENGRI